MEGDGYRGGVWGWLGLVGGLAFVLGFGFFLAQGYTPPGPMGEVLRNNQRFGLDANPLFYTEVERSQNFSYRELFVR